MHEKDQNYVKKGLPSLNYIGVWSPLTFFPILKHVSFRNERALVLGIEVHLYNELEMPFLYEFQYPSMHQKSFEAV